MSEENPIEKTFKGSGKEEQPRSDHTCVCECPWWKNHARNRPDGSLGYDKNLNEDQNG